MMETDGNVAFPAVLYAEPSALGLLANVLSAFIVAMQNFLQYSDKSPLPFYVSGIYLILVGGVIQVLAGFLSFRRNDHLGGTAFITFSALWTAQGIFNILTPQYAQNPAFKDSVFSGLVPFCLIAVILFSASLTVNYIMPPVLVAMFVALVFECVGLYFPWALYVAGVCEMTIVFFGIYGASASMLRGISQRYVWPGFGNAPVNVLLIKTKTPAKKTRETKKNTKYAEPMALGYMCNIVPAAILAFSSFGYSTSFQISLMWMIPVCLAQLFSSFYAFLRNDLYHTFAFSVYLIVWFGKSGTEFIFTSNPTFTQTALRTESLFGVWAALLLVVCAAVISLSRDVVAFCVNLSFVLLLVLGYEFIPVTVYGYTFGVANVVVCLVSAYAGFSSLVNSIAEKPVIPVGREIVSGEKLAAGFLRLRCTLAEKLTPRNTTSLSEVAQLISMSATTVASLYGATVDVTSGYPALPWLLGAGVLLQLFAARCFYASGALAKMYISLLCAAFWLAWGSLVIWENLAGELLMSAIILVSLGAVALFVSVAFTRTWLILSILMEVNMVCFLLNSAGKYPEYLSLSSMIATSVVSFYGAMALLLNSSFYLEVLPLGKPIFTIKEKVDTIKRAEFKSAPACPLYKSSLTSGLHGIAEVLDKGGVCGIPTDTVYALAASCKHPDSIERLYRVKERPAEKPICLCLSSLEQLKDADPNFSPLLWRFMKNCYPGGISCVVPKGDWLRRLGVGEASSFVGTPQSVCIRVPDSTVVSHLVSLTGPIAITSANPSGAPDSTHHDMVLGSLGHKIDGLLCDGPSNHSVASTVVNCMKIDEGVITYFRIGCVPKEVVDNIFETTKKTMYADIAA